MISSEQITVIIPTLQKNVTVLNNLLDVLLRDTSVKEIIVIDNSLKGLDKSNDKLRVITPKKNLYVNPSWNLGVQEAKTEYFALFNDDLMVCENFCSKLLSLIIDKDDLGIMGMDTNSVVDTSDMSIPDETQFDLIKEDVEEERKHNWGVIIAGRKSTYNKIPNHIKILCGDDYLRFITKQNKLKIYDLANADVHHLGATSSGLKVFFKQGLVDIVNYSKIDPQMKNTGFYKHAKYELSVWRKVRENILSIKNSKDKSHKVITILGIKIKLKRHKKN